VVRDFFRAVQIGPEAYSVSSTVCTGFFPGVKWPERAADDQTPSNASLRMGRVFASVPGCECHGVGFTCYLDT
jgi:hypothetical protein